MSSSSSSSYTKQVNETDIAVVGISSILASGENLYENWESIRTCLDHVSDLPADRVDVTAYYNPDKTAKDQVYCKRGYFIPDYDIDPRDYGLNFNQVEDSDANQLLTLLKVKEALSDAGLPPNSKERRNVGVVLGIGGGQKASHEFYSRLNYVVMEKVLNKMGMPEADVKIAVDKYKSQFPEWRVDSFPGFLGNVTAGRCCNVFNLDGMNCVVDAACASSLIALKVAIDELLHGDCETMVCGATCTDNSLGMYMAFSKTPVFSTDPGVKAYDETTKGMLIGEGSVMMVLKKLSKAIADGDQVHAVIRGVASSSDGKAPGIYVPTISGQELCIERAWAKVHEELKTCTLMEGHGTGTPVGDKIELTGMRNQFELKGGCAKEQVAVGSIKSQIGHTKAVAGFAGLVKVILALKHKVLPFTLNVKNPPTLMDGTKLSDTCLYANLRNRPWFVPREIGIRRAGISSFGFGGANYHMVVEEFEPEHTKPYRMHDLPLPVVFHASTSKELVTSLKAIVGQLEANAHSQDAILRDQAHDELLAIRQANQVGAFQVMPASHVRVGLLASDKPKDFCQDLKMMIEALEREPSKEEIKLRSDFIYKARGLDCRGKVAALFAGQGSQYLNMYEDVAMNWPEFRQAVVDMDKASSQICGQRASAFMFPRTPYQTEPDLLKKQEAEISTVRNAQLAITSVSVGSFAIFQRAGFKPDFVAGHSLGEYAALHAGGALDRTEVCELVCNRATAMQSAFQPGEDMGRMIAVVGDNVESKVRPEAQDVWVANMNSPSQVVLTGSAKGIEQDAARLAALGFRVHPLNTGGAFHSPKMAPAERVFYERLAASKILALKHDAPRAYGNVSGELYPVGDADAVRKGLAKQMTSSVQFTSQIRAMYKDGARVFVEFGPKNILAKLVTQILGENSGAITISLNPSSTKSADHQLREAALQCALAGVQFQSAFDPWGTRNPFKGIGGYFNDAEADKKARRSMTRVKMSAATYVSKKTLEERQRVMGDGKLLSCFTSQTPRSAAANPGGFDSNKEELARLRSQLEDAKREAATKALEAEKLREALAKQQAQTNEHVSSGQKLHIEQMLLNYEDLTKQIKGALGGAAPVAVAASSSSARPAAAAAAAAPAAAGGVDRAYVEKVLRKVLSESTGFDESMLTNDLNLEEDLGIDSIKRVEFVSNVSGQFGVTVGTEAMDKLARTRLVGEVVEVFVNDVFAGASAAPAGAAAPVAAAAAAAPASNNGKSMSRDDVVGVLRKVLSDSTGFDEQLLTMDLNLEEDLGVDSIKRVEFVSNVSALLNITVSSEAMDQLARTRLVGEVCDVFCSVLLPAGGAAAAAAAPVAAAAAVASAPAAGGLSRDQITKVLQKVLSESTGFDEGMLTNDLNLEEDLGIDSIKRVEFVSNVSGQFGVTVGPEAMDKLARTRLVGEVVDVFVNDVFGSAAPAAVSAPKPAAAAPVAAAAKPASNGGMSRDQITKVLQKVLSESTGFDESMLTNDLNLEEDLGIDSIKRVEFVSNVSGQFGVTVGPEAMDKLARTRLVGEVVDVFVNDVFGSAAAAAPVAAAAAPVAAAPKPAAASNGSGLSRDQITKVLQKVLSDSTGFDEAMLTNDLNLEEDLGIDSIKRVEFVSNVSGQFGVTVGPEAMDKLARTRLVGEVVDVFVNDVFGGASSAPAAPVAAAPVAAAAAAPASNGGMGRDEVVKILQKVLSDSTGFDEAMLTPDLNLEEDLGIDSIKRVEFVSNVSSLLNITVGSEAMDQLARTRLVGEVCDVFCSVVIPTGSAAAPAPVAAAAKPAAAAAPVAAAAPAPASSGFDRARVTKILQKVLSESTGFDESMLTDDLNLEEDLGVDSIKRVELISNVSAMFNVPVGPEAMDKLGRTRLVGEVIDVFCANVGASSAPAPAAAAAAKGDSSKPLRAADCGHLTLTSATAVEIPQPDRQKLQRAADRPIVVVDDGSALASQLANKLGGVLLAFGSSAGSAGKNVVVLTDASEAALQDGLAQVAKRFGVPGGFIYLPSAQQPSPVRGDIAKQNCWAMLAAKHVKPFLADQPVSKGRATFIGVSRLDGKLGLAGGSAKADDDLVAIAERGAIFGLCKTLDLEWANAFCRGVDLAPELSAEDAVECLLRELDDANLNLREVGYAKDKKRYTTRAVNLVPGSVPATPIDKSDVWVVTGGARGITPLCIAALAKQIGGGTYLLLGRSKLVPEPAWSQGKQAGKELDAAATQFAKDQFAAGKGEKPTPKVVRALSNGVEATREILDSLASIGQTGAKAEYIGVDVSNADQVAKALHGRNVTGIFHASGVLRDKMIQNKTPEDFEAVYGTKVYGLRALFKVVPPSSLRHLVVFSSLAGFHGNRGQSDYSLANEVLNKAVFVVQSKFPQCSARALDFGPWGGGMVTPALQKMFEDQGVEIIPRQGGAETVANVLLNTAASQCLFGNWGLPPVRPLEPVIKITRELDTNAQGVNKFLHSHVVKGKRVVPFTIMTQTMGQMAINTHPGYALHAVTDIQLYRGLVCEPGVDAVQMEFTLQDLKAEDGRLEVEVKASFNVNGKDVPSYKCVAVLGERARPAFSAPALSQADTAGKVLSKTEAYNGKVLFHGQDFQSIQTVTVCSEDRVVAELVDVDVTGRDGQFPVQGVVDGYVTDTAYQLALVHARLQHQSGALPNFAKSIDYYTAVPAGTKAYGVLLKEKDNEQQKGDAKIVKWQFYVCSAQGTVFQAGRISVVLNPGLTWE